MAAAAAGASRSFTRSSPNLLRLICKTPKSISPSSPLFSSSAPSRSSVLRFASVLASAESMMPLHTAIASARLKSKIAVSSACWSCLSQGFATPL